MRNDYDATFFGMVQTSLDFVVKKIIDTFETLGVAAVLDLDRIIDDYEIGTEAGDAALDRERAYPAAMVVTKSMSLARSPFTRVWKTC